jgi:hypothetical protein
MAYIDKITCEMVMAELEAAATEIFSKHGLDKPKVKGKYGSALEIKLTTSILDLVGGVNVASPEAVAFKTNARYYGVSDDALGEVFTSNGHEFQLTGFLPRGQRYQFQAKRLDTGQTYKFAASTIKAKFPRALV